MMYFLIFLVLVGFAISPYFVSDSFGLCVENQDWQDAPCYGCMGCYPGLEQEKIDWSPYYDFKGSTWMNAKKQQLETAMHNNSLREWFEQSGSGAHENVHKYYFLQGEVQNTYGMNFDEALGFERAWNAVEDNSPNAPLFLWTYHDVILDGTLIETDLAITITGDHVPLYHIKANKYFKGEKNSDMITAVENTDDLEFDLFENGLFYLKKLNGQSMYTATIASAKTFGNCDARSLIEISPTLPNEKSPVSMPARPIGIDPCVPDYFDVDPDGIITDVILQDEPTSQNESMFPRHGFHAWHIPPLKQFKSGILIDKILCKEDLVLIQKYDGLPACVTESTKQKLIERGWVKSEDYPFGLTGPVMNQETCNSFVISQWQPTVEGKEKVQKFLEICIQRGFTTPELVERGKVANNFTTGSIQSAQTSAKGDLEKTIEILEEMHRENEN